MVRIKDGSRIVNVKIGYFGFDEIFRPSAIWKEREVVVLQTEKLDDTWLLVEFIYIEEPK